MAEVYRRRMTPSDTLILDFDGGTLSWATETRISDAWLWALEEKRKQNRRAPLGDSHGCWQKIGEVPIATVNKKIPFDAFEDTNAWRKILNDPDNRKLRADGDHRVF